MPDFNSIAELKATYHKLPIVVDLGELRARSGHKEAKAINGHEIEAIAQFVETPKDALLRDILWSAQAILVKTTDGSRPYQDGYTTFALHIGHQTSESLILYTVLIPTPEYEHHLLKTRMPAGSLSSSSTPNQSPRVSRKTPNHSAETLSKVFEPIEPVIVDFSGIPLLILLQELFNSANCQGIKFAQDKSARLIEIRMECSTGGASVADIIAAVGDQAKTEYTEIDIGSGRYGKRFLGITIDDNTLDAKLYDFYHGTGKAAYIVADLKRKAQNKAAGCSCVLS